MAYKKETIEQARILYSLGASTQDIADELKLNSRRVVYTWAERFNWHGKIDTSSLVIKTSRRLNWLIEKDNKSDADWLETSKLGDLLIKLEKADAFKRGVSAPASRRGRKPSQKSGTGRRRKKVIPNDVSEITVEMLDEVEERVFYPHQKIWLKAGRDPKTNLLRFILKSRQIGATYTFAWEAFRTAVETGVDQIFISSTKAQAEQFKAYIYLLAKEHFNIELKGNPTKLNTAHGTVEIHYLSPNSYANSRSGDVYFDEVFYTKSFAKMEVVAAPMATLDTYKQTYFGAPTTASHQANDVWTGKRFTKHNPEVTIDVSDYASMFNGRLDADGFWRCVCTVDSAIEMGWDKVTLERLRIKTPDPELFENIYRCKFIDDAHSVFKLSEIMACAVDPLSWFPDFDKERLDRPAGDQPISVGYDPAGVADNAAICAMSYPQSASDKFRLYEKQTYRNMVASVQALKIVDLCRRYNVEYLDIDRSGPGLYIPDEVSMALRNAGISPPRTMAMQSTLQSKAKMVQKALNVISQQRFEYDEDDTTLPLAFMSVRQSVTEKTGEISYYSSRSTSQSGEGHGHGDEAWACMHGFMCEGMNAAPDSGGSSVSFSH